MRLQILDLARRDLIEGFHFYEDKEKGLGDYFLVSLYSDIESLKVFGGTHRKRIADSTEPFRNDSHSRFITCWVYGPLQLWTISRWPGPL